MRARQSSHFPTQLSSIIRSFSENIQAILVLRSDAGMESYELKACIHLEPRKSIEM